MLTLAIAFFVNQRTRHDTRYGSEMKRLDQHTFTIQLLVHRGTPSQAYRKLASEVYGFRDERDNSGPGSLNAGLERMGNYLADADGNNFQQWDAIQKYTLPFLVIPSLCYTNQSILWCAAFIVVVWRCSARVTMW